MSDLIVQRVTSRRQRKQFLNFPWTFYRDDPNWIPPLRSNQKEMVGYVAHPFYARNSIQTFLAMRGDEVCGRIAAILNQGHNERYHERRGFFGFFDCVDDQEAANALFDAVRDWFAKQGIYRLRGPANPSLNYELGLLIDGFDSPPTFMMTYNPPYYARLMENYGFRKTQDLYAFWGHADMLPAISRKLGPVAQQIIEHYNVHLRPLDRRHFSDDVKSFLSLYNRSLANTWGFVPMTDAEVHHMAEGLRHLIVPELAVAAEIDGQMIGAAFGLPDYNPRIKEINGRLFPFGVIHLLHNKQAIKRIRVISTNVLPEYQRMGVGLALMNGLAPMAEKWGLEEAEFSWVLESNSLSRGSLAKGGAKINKTYRLYDLDEEPPQQAAAAIAAVVSTPLRVGTPATPPVEIRQVRSAGDLRRFIKVPWRIYAEDPQWVPPLLVEVKEFLNPRKHPFYQHGEATQFLALRDGTPVGRILASDDPLYNQEHGSNVGCFGMFESVDDPQVAHALLDAAAQWLRSRGRSGVIGPIDYSVNYPCGLLIDGFDTPPRVMMNHNPIYYQRLLESWGLSKAKDLYAWWFTDPYDMVKKWRVRAERIARRSKVVVRAFRKSDFDNDVKRCQAVYNESMVKNWGFVRFTDPEFYYLAKRLSQTTVPEQVLLAEIDGRTVGFAITVPDINEAIRPLNGRLTTLGIPVGLGRFFHRLHRVKTARMLALCVSEPYRRRGIAELLILRTLDYGKNTLGYINAELSWTMEDNGPVNHAIEAVGGQRYKTYRTFQRDWS
jgi:GNAT superfamily N-acetyltransferase